MTAEIQQASDLIKQGQDALNQALSHLKQVSSKDGKLDADLLEQHQLAHYEIAYCAAELQAASLYLDYSQRVRQLKGNDSALRLEERFALQFAAETLLNLRTRFNTRRRDFGFDKAQLEQHINSTAVDDFINHWLATSTLAELGQTLADSDGYLGEYMLEEEKEMMRDSFHTFAYDVVQPLAEHIHTQDADIPDEIIKPLAELGTFGLSIPMRYGGIQPDDQEDNLGMIVVTEELSRGSLGAAGSLITRPEILSRALMQGGTEAQKQYWMPKLAQGDVLNAVAVTEPNYGSDVAAMKLKATQTQGGWVLNGEKTWCTFAGRAQVLMTLARTDPDPAAKHRGLTMFLVEKPSFPGHHFKHTQAEGGTLEGKAIPTIGYRGMHSFTVFYDNYFVPDSHVMGLAEGIGKGFYYTMAGFAGGRIQTAARATGVMQSAFEQALKYAKERHVFGKAVADYPLTLVKLARMGMLLAVSRQFTYEVARMMDKGEGQMEASLVKLYACKSSEWLCREAMQIHGGMGYAEETMVSRLFIDSRVLSIFEGAEETLALRVIAKNLIENAE